MFHWFQVAVVGEFLRVMKTFFSSLLTTKLITSTKTVERPSDSISAYPAPPIDMGLDPRELPPQK